MTKYLAIAALLAACIHKPPAPGPKRALKVVNNQNSERAKRLAVDDHHVYILDGNDKEFSIRRFPRGGGELEIVTPENESGKYPTALAVDATHLYWLVDVFSGDDIFGKASEHHTRLFRAEKRIGTRLEELAYVEGKPGDLVLVEGDVFFSTLEYKPAIHRVPRAGGRDYEVVTFPEESSPRDLLLHDGKLLVAESKQGAVIEVSFAGQVREVMKVPSPEEIAAFGDKLAVVAYQGVFEFPSGKQIARGSRMASFEAIAASPEGIYYKHDHQLRFLAWGAAKAEILQKVSYDLPDVVVTDEGLYYVASDEVWFRARAKP